MPENQNRPGSKVRPLTEGYVVKGGHNTGRSQIASRPPPPAPMNAKSRSPSPTPARNGGAGRNDR